MVIMEGWFMKKLKNILKSQSGAALIIVLLLTTVIGISTSALYLNSLYSTENSVYGERKLEATQIAKGGVEEGLAYLEKSLEDEGKITPHSISRLDDGWYDVEILSTSKDTFSIQSTAKYDTLFGDKEVTYVVNGKLDESGTSIGGLVSSFFDHTVVTSYANDINEKNFKVYGYSNVTVDGSFVGNYDVPSWSPFNIDEDKVLPPISSIEFNDEYDNLIGQLDDIYLFPDSLSVKLPDITGTKVFNDLLKVDVINIKWGGDIVFKGDVYANELIIANGDGFNIIFEGDVYVKKISISSASGHVNFKKNVTVANDFNLNGSMKLTVEGNVNAENVLISSSSEKIHFMQNVIARDKFRFTNGSGTLVVDGVIITNTYDYLSNYNSNYSVSYIVAKEKIDIGNTSGVHSGGLASPNIEIHNLGTAFIDLNGLGTGDTEGNEGSTGANGSYIITDWHVE